MKQDEKLREARTGLVPKDLDEEAFWRSYFFRVNMLKRAFGVSELPQLKEGAKLPEPQKMRSSLANSSSSQATRESNSDLSSSNSSIILPSIDELLPSDDSDDSDGLVGESDDELLEPRSLALEFADPDSKASEDTEENSTYDAAKDGTSNMLLDCKRLTTNFSSHFSLFRSLGDAQRILRPKTYENKFATHNFTY